MQDPRYPNLNMRPSVQQPQPQPSPSRPPAPVVFWKQRWFQVVLGILIMVALAGLIYGYITTRAELNSLSKSKGNDVQQLVDQIGKTIVLPNETPTLATVNDVSKLKTQEFFQNAQNGDKVLIFSNSGRALLYRPSTKKVIEYSKVDLNTSSQNK